MASIAVAPVRDLSGTTDEDLMRRYQAGDNQAFDELFKRYSPMVASIIRRGVRREEQVAELVQKVFLRLHRARHTYLPAQSFRPWLCVIALNTRRDQVRRAVRCLEIQVTPQRLPILHPSTVDELENAQLVDIAMRDLPQRTQKILRLHWFQNKTFAEIATILGIGLSAVKVAAHRSYGQMRCILEEQQLMAA